VQATGPGPTALLVLVRPVLVRRVRRVVPGPPAGAAAAAAWSGPDPVEQDADREPMTRFTTAVAIFLRPRRGRAEREHT